MSTTIVAGAKGGQGHDNRRHVLAVTAALRDRCVVLIDTVGDAASILDHPPIAPSDDLAVRRAAAVPCTPDHVVPVRERLRSLAPSDVERALALPVTSIDHNSVLARAIDAGLLVTHAHRPIGRPLRQLV